MRLCPKDMLLVLVSHSLTRLCRHQCAATVSAHLFLSLYYLHIRSRRGAHGRFVSPPLCSPNVPSKCTHTLTTEFSPTERPSKRASTSTTIDHPNLRLTSTNMNTPSIFIIPKPPHWSHYTTTQVSWTKFEYFSNKHNIYLNQAETCKAPKQKENTRKLEIGFYEFFLLLSLAPTS